MSELSDVMMKLIRYEMSGNAPREGLRERLDDEFLQGLYELSYVHDLTHLVGSALQKNDLLSPGKQADRFSKRVLAAVWHYEKLAYEAGRIGRVLSSNGISYIPLKGAVLRQYYPEPWMRTSCDVDILVHQADMEKAAGALVRELDYRFEEKDKTPHDWQLHAPGDIEVELHFGLVEPGRAKEAGRVLAHVWDHATPDPAADDACRQLLDDPMFYFYHVAHMAKHIEIGGCGVRPFLDLWVLSHRVPHDRAARAELLEKGGLSAFEQAAVRLSEVWFSGAEPDNLTADLQDFLLAGGLYGTVETRVAVLQHREGGRFRYLLSRVFQPYDKLKYQYPVLKKHKWLLPFMQMRRWCRILFGRKKTHADAEIEAYRASTKEQRARTANLMKQIGL